jgi:hypothetical protein
MESSAFPENLSGKLRCSPHIQALSWRRALALSGNVAGCMALTRNPGHAKTQKMPSRTRRSSTRGTPGGFGSNALTAAYS